MYDFILGILFGAFCVILVYVLCEAEVLALFPRWMRSLCGNRIERYSEPHGCDRTKFVIVQVMDDSVLARGADSDGIKDYDAPLVLLDIPVGGHYDGEIIEIADPIVIGLYRYYNSLGDRNTIQVISSKPLYERGGGVKRNICRAVSMMVMSTAAALSLTSCDEHQPLDMGIYPGFVLCDDHTSMTLDSYMRQDKVNAVGVIFAVATEEHPMLAVMLEEIAPVQFADTLYFSQGTSCDVESYDGFTNTVSLQNSYDRKTGHGSPLGDAAFRFHKYGQSDYIPSVAEMRLLVSALPTVNPVISALGGSPISLDSEGGTCLYWTSTEVAENKGNQAWLVSAVNGAYQQTPKDETHPARAIVSLNY